YPSDVPIFQQHDASATVGRHQPVGFDVLGVVANDPSASQFSPLTFTIVAGDPNGDFMLSPASAQGILVPNAAMLELAKNGWELSQETYTLTIEATDAAGLTDTMTVTVNMRTTVAITGDYYAVEGTNDNISLVFTRFAYDLSQPLVVNINTNWLNTLPYD